MSPRDISPARKFAFAFLALLSCALTACGGDGGASGPITVSVTASPGTVAPSATAQIIATVSNDPSNGGVTWSVACPTAPCGGVSSTTTASGVATTYTAPAVPPTAGMLVTFTATAVSNSTVAATASVNVTGGIAISELDIANPGVLAGTTTQLTAKLVNDSANRGVSWSVSCAAPPCGTISPTASASGVPVTYTAPAAVPPADLSVTVTVSTVSAPSVQASATITVPALAVTVTPSGVRMAAGASAQFTATVNYPAPASKGVTWTVQCSAANCGTVSPSTSASGAAVTYTAPPTAPPADLVVTLTASSVSAPSVQGSVTLTVGAVTVAVTPVSALIPLNVSQPFTGNVGYDPSSDGITWTLMQGGAPCTASCGALSPSATANGGSTTYAAPSLLPSQSTVMVTATAVADPTKSASASVHLTAGSVWVVPDDLGFGKGAGSDVATLTNAGATPLVITGITLGGTNPASFSQTNTCGNSVAAGKSCTITVSHRLSRAHATALVLIADSSSDSPQQIYLHANGAYQVTAAIRTALAERTAAATPPPSGGSQVGTRVLYLSDASRTDPYVANGTRRELPVRFWYPSSIEGGCVAASYAPVQVWSYFATLVGAPLPSVSTRSCLNAPIATGRHPVVVVEHGFTGTFTDYTFLAEDLASRGYLVVALDHTHEATAVEFPDGRLEKSVFGSHLTQYTRSDAGALGLAVAVRLDDLRFALNELTRLDAAPGGDLAGRLDLSRVALIGHSLGGLTTLRALQAEPRFKAGVVLDAVMPPHFAKPIEQPVLSLVAGRRQWNEDDCRLWDVLQGRRAAVNFPGAEHIAFSDAVWLLKGNVSTGTTSEAMIAATRSYVAAFLDANLRGQDLQLLLAGFAAGTSGAVVADGSQPLCTLP